jgi:signal peptidase I
MNQLTKIVAIILVFSLIVLLFASVDVGLIQEISENPQYFYASTGYGTSMEPFIEHGDMLVVMSKNNPDFSISIGDVVVYAICGECNNAIAHRVFNIRGNTHYVKGDNNNAIEVISYNSIVGKVVKVIDGGNIIGKAFVNSVI